MKDHYLVIISPSVGEFTPNRVLEKVLKECGFTTWDNIEARTNEKVISLIQTHLKKAKNQFDVAFLGKEKDQYLSLIEVDINRPWTISNQDGSERVSYLDYTLIQPDLNFYL